MKDIEIALKELSEVQGTQINELMDLVNQNKQINEEMRVSIKAIEFKDNIVHLFQTSRYFLAYAINL